MFWGHLFIIYCQEEQGQVNNPSNLPRTLLSRKCKRLALYYGKQGHRDAAIAAESFFSKRVCALFRLFVLTCICSSLQPLLLLLGGALVF